MLFRKKITRDCSYCQFGTNLDSWTVLCSKKGARPNSMPCMRFKYDPCKRIPVKSKALDFSRYDDQDFSL